MSTQIDNAKALSHPLRVRILEALAADEPSSPAKLSVTLDEPLGNVSYHVKTLSELGMVELVSTAPRRGAVEHYYQRTVVGRGAGTDAGALDYIAGLFRLSVSPSNALKEIGAVVAATGRAIA